MTPGPRKHELGAYRTEYTGTAARSHVGLPDSVRKG
jgi:hypothetical protein